MGVGPVALISSLLSQSIPACPKLCTPKIIPSNYTVVDPYPLCLTKCPASATIDWNPEYQNMASTVALMVGVIMIILAPVLGWFMNFVPSPVIMGFTTGGGLIIAMGQLKDVMGYPIRKDRLHEGIEDFFKGLGNTHGITCAMGVSSAVFLFIIRKLTQGRILWWKVPMPAWVKQVALLPWAFGLVVLYTGISASLNLASKGVAVVGSVPPGLPSMAIPRHVGENIPKLISVTITIVIIGYLESIAVETKFANMFKYQIDPTQESYAQVPLNATPHPLTSRTRHRRRTRAQNVGLMRVVQNRFTP
jgi:MFS superfamily sulfate permease-like transporter